MLTAAVISIFLRDEYSLPADIRRVRAIPAAMLKASASVEATAYFIQSLTDPLYIYFESSSVNFAIVPGMSIVCGHTAAQAPHPMQAEGFLSSGKAARAIGAMNPPSV